MEVDGEEKAEKAKDEKETEEAEEGDKEKKEGEDKKDEQAKEKDEKVVESKPEKRATRGSMRKQSVSIAPPQITLQQMEQMAKSGMMYDMEMMNDLMAQTYASTIKWPKDKVLILRLQHIMECVKTGTWPVEAGYSLGDHMNEVPDMPENQFDQKPEVTLVAKEAKEAAASPKAAEATPQAASPAKAAPTTPPKTLNIEATVEVVGKTEDEEKKKTSKIRQLLTSPLSSKHEEEEDPIAK